MASPTIHSATPTVNETAATPANLNDSVTEISEIAQQSREQFVSGLQQGQQWSIDAAQSWVKAISVLPVMEMPQIPGIPAIADLQTATKYTFDVAADLLNAQRAYALQLTDTFLPAKTA